jgi:hypothetical protein
MLMLVTSVRVIKASPALQPRTEIERRIYGCIDDANATFEDLRALYREARESEFNTYVSIDWGRMTILIHTRWPNGMRELIGV